MNLKRKCSQGVNLRVELVLPLCCTFLLAPSYLLADSGDDFFEMDLEQLLNVEVSSASLTKVSNRLSPSTVSYITAEQIDRLGARTLSDVLTLIPGIDVQERRNGRNMVWIRGIPSGRNTKVMLLIDGVPHREPVFGGWSPDEEVALNNIDRIEVIRGPGSALYGGNAYSGLISIFTKDKAPEKSKIQATIGSFDSHRLQGITGGNVGNGSWVLSSSLYQTQGHSMARDRRGLATDHNNEVSSYNGQLKVTFDNVKFGVNVNHYNTEYPLYSVRQTKPQDYEIFSAFADHSRELYSGNWSNKAYVYKVNREMDRRRWDEQGEHFFRAFSFLDTQLTGLTSRYTKTWNNHTIVTGATYEVLQVKEYAEVITLSNYQPTLVMQSVLDKNGDNTPTSNSHALFIQDEISLFDNKLGMTLGLRYDSYQEFGAEYSPRVSVVYTPDDIWTVKAMWGTAFRPPSNLQQYEVRSDGNSPGNPSVEPEEITTSEVDVSYRISQTQNISTRIFRNSLSDFIQSVNTQPYDNIGETKSITGAELEYVSQFQLPSLNIEHINVRASATYLDTDEPSVARRTAVINSMADLDWGRMSLTLNYIGSRNESDMYHTRVTDPLIQQTDNKGSYVTLDMNFQFQRPWSLPIDLELSAFNLLDREYYNPTYAPDSYYDVTRQPRYISVSAKYTF